MWTCCWPTTCARFLTLSLATFTSYSIFFTILGVPYSILLAALAATLEFIPVIGALSAGAHHLIVTASQRRPDRGRRWSFC